MSTPHAPVSHATPRQFYDIAQACRTHASIASLLAGFALTAIVFALEVFGPPPGQPVGPQVELALLYFGVVLIAGVVSASSYASLGGADPQNKETWAMLLPSGFLYSIVWPLTPVGVMYLFSGVVGAERVTEFLRAGAFCQFVLICAGYRSTIGHAVAVVSGRPRGNPVVTRLGVLVLFVVLFGGIALAGVTGALPSVMRPDPVALPMLALAPVVVVRGTQSLHTGLVGHPRVFEGVGLAYLVALCLYFGLLALSLAPGPGASG